MLTSDGDSRLRIFMLGQFTVQAGTRAIEDARWNRRKARHLVQLLALAPRGRLHREEIMEWLWPEQDPHAAANSLHQVLFLARRILGTVPPGAGASLQLEHEQVTLCAGSPCWTDVDGFEAAAAQARRRQTIPAYHAAISLYAGDLLPDEPYAEWAAQRREHLRALHVALLLELSMLQEDRGEAAPAINSLAELLAHDPANEEAHRHLMRLYAGLGRRQQALRQYRTLRQALRRELDAQPDDESEALYRRIRAGGAGAPGSQGTAPGRAGRTPPLTAHGPATRSSGNLPFQYTSFVGREREKAAVLRLLRESRLLTLTGPGGCGKTRLALEAAAAVQNLYHDGVWLVELGPLSDPALVTTAIAEALSVGESAGRPAMDTLSAHLRSRQLLLILDNCEHLIDACAEVTGSLMQAAPDMRVLATSRERLRISGELAYLVPPLSLPDPRHPPPLTDLPKYEAIRLFLERARAAWPEFEVTAETAGAIVEICARLDGIPLAIELAAALIRLLSVGEIDARLDDRFRLLAGGSRTAPSRQQTLWAAIDWSYGLLTDQERASFRRLSIFAGGFTLAAAEMVCSPPPEEELNLEYRAPRGDTLNVLTRLVDKSLIGAEQGPGKVETRYRLLETTRAYAYERLEEAGESEVMHVRHRSWCSALVDQTNGGLWGPEHVPALTRLERDYENVRAALAWRPAGESGESHDRRLRLANGLWQYWILEGMLNEGRYWLDSALAGPAQPTRLRALAMLSDCSMAMRAGDNASITPLAQESRQIFRALGDGSGTSRAGLVLASVAWLRGEHSLARARLEESQRDAEQANDDGARAATVHQRGVVDASQGNHAAAAALMAESLAGLTALDSRRNVCSLWLNLFPLAAQPLGQDRCRALDSGTFVLLRELDANAASALALANMGCLAWMAGDPAAAEARLEDALSHFSRAQDQAGMGLILAELGTLAGLSGSDVRGRLLLEESLKLRRSIGDRRGAGRALCALGSLATAQGQFERAKQLLDESLASFTAMGDRPGLAATYGHLARLALAQADHRLAMEHFSKSLALMRDLGARPGIAACLFNLGVVNALAGNREEAHRRLTAGLTAFTEIGDRRGVRDAERELAALDGERVATG